MLSGRMSLTCVSLNVINDWPRHLRGKFFGGAGQLLLASQPYHRHERPARLRRLSQASPTLISRTPSMASFRRISASVAQVRRSRAYC